MSKTPTIAMIPSAYKSGKVYSVLPTDGSGDLNFTRASEATRVNQNGLIEKVGSNVPRIDYTDGGCPKLLLEPLSRNLVTHSEDFTNAVWSKSNATVTANSTISPKGDLTADTFELTGSAGRLQRNVTLSDNTDYTLSSFVKPISVTNNLLGVVAIRKDGSVSSAIFNISNGIIDTETNCTAKIESYTNGWYRLSITFDSLSGATSPSIRPISNSTGSGGFTTGDSIYIWGAQLEEGSYPTSYIPTNGQEVTREAETCNGAGNASTFNDSEGVLFAEISFPSQTTSSNLRIAISDGTTNNTILIQNVGSTANRLQFYLISNGGTSTDFYTDLSNITSLNKIVFKYKENDFSVWINGFEVLTDTNGSTFPNGTLSELNFDGGDGNNDFYGKTKALKVYNQALTDLELEEMTGFKSFVQMANYFNYTVI